MFNKIESTCSNCDESYIIVVTEEQEIPKFCPFCGLVSEVEESEDE